MCAASGILPWSYIYDDNNIDDVVKPNESESIGTFATKLSDRRPLLASEASKRHLHIFTCSVAFLLLCLCLRKCMCVRARLRACELVCVLKIPACRVPECKQDSEPDRERTRDLADGLMGLWPLTF